MSDSELTYNHRITHLLKIPDWPFANEFQYMVLAPVEPVHLNPYYKPGNPQAVPYWNDPTAHLFPVSRDTGTYEMIHYCRRVGGLCPECTPQNIGQSRGYGDYLDGQPPPDVPAGIMGAIVAYSHRPRLGSIDNYCIGPPYQVDECLYDYWCRNVLESIWRHYRGNTSYNRIHWTADPQQRGWWVQYRTDIFGWFTQDTFWARLASGGPAGLAPGPWRWSAWFKGLIDYTTNGDVDDAEFAAWITTQDSAFGVEYRPLNSYCNDVLLQCAGQPNGIAWNVFPSQQTQQDSLFDNEPPPCLRAGLGPSRWFLPLSECNPDVPRPDCPNYLIVRRKVFTNPQRTTFVNQDRWVKLQWFSTPPKIRVLETPDP